MPLASVQEGHVAIEASVSLAELPAGKHMPLSAAQLNIVQAPHSGLHLSQDTPMPDHTCAAALAASAAAVVDSATAAAIRISEADRGATDRDCTTGCTALSATAIRGSHEEDECE